jgi:hypothetical protein
MFRVSSRITCRAGGWIDLTTLIQKRLGSPEKFTAGDNEFVISFDVSRELRPVVGKLPHCLGERRNWRNSRRFEAVRSIVECTFNDQVMITAMSVSVPDVQVGGSRPGEESHPLTFTAVSACRAFRSNSSRSIP